MFHCAKLSFVASEHQGQRFKLYALTSVSFPEELTFANAPANGKGTEMLLEYVYGAKPLGTFTFDGEGKATVEVTDYIRACAQKTAIFVVTSEKGSLLYLNLDFSMTDEVVTNSITSNGDLTLEDGELTTTGTSITIHNAFASTETTLPALTPVIVRFATEANTSFTVSIDGTEYTASVTATNGVAEVRFIPTVEAKAESITITSSSSGCTITSVVIESAAVANLLAPTLECYTPATPVYDFEGVIAGHNMIIGESLSYNLYFAMDKDIQSVYVNGKAYDFASLREATIGGATYKLLVLDTVAKDAFVSQTVTVTLKDGSYANYEINVRRYLEQFFKSAANAEEKSLAANMTPRAR